jgi:hypothetical protein
MCALKCDADFGAFDAALVGLKNVNAPSVISSLQESR